MGLITQGGGIVSAEPYKQQMHRLDPPKNEARAPSLACALGRAAPSIISFLAVEQSCFMTKFFSQFLSAN